MLSCLDRWRNAFEPRVDVGRAVVGGGGCGGVDAVELTVVEEWGVAGGCVVAAVVVDAAVVPEKINVLEQDSR